MRPSSLKLLFHRSELSIDSTETFNTLAIGEATLSQQLLSAHYQDAKRQLRGEKVKFFGKTSNRIYSTIRAMPIPVALTANVIDVCNHAPVLTDERTAFAEGWCRMANLEEPDRRPLSRIEEIIPSRFAFGKQPSKKFDIPQPADTIGRQLDVTCRRTKRRPLVALPVTPYDAMPTGRSELRFRGNRFKLRKPCRGEGRGRTSHRGDEAEAVLLIEALKRQACSRGDEAVLLIEALKTLRKQPEYTTEGRLEANPLFKGKANDAEIGTMNSGVWRCRRKWLGQEANTVVAMLLATGEFNAKAEGQPQQQSVGCPRMKRCPLDYRTIEWQIDFCTLRQRCAKGEPPSKATSKEGMAQDARSSNRTTRNRHWP
uniref:Uncharacterized protein n=1 Tax=Trichuris muris TaxID=70415 RepID=A0A5S6R638_TRIMR